MYTLDQFRADLFVATKCAVAPLELVRQDLVEEQGGLTVETIVNLPYSGEWGDRQWRGPVPTLSPELAHLYASSVRWLLERRGDLPKPRLHGDLIAKLADLRRENADSPVAWRGLNDLIVLLGCSDVDARAAG